MTLRFTSRAVTHPGRVRDHNEDSLIERPEIGLWAVADGMGGHAAGEVASAMVCNALAQALPPLNGRDFIAEIKALVLGAHEDIRALAHGRGKGTMGSTVVILLTFRDHYACLWAGDSRLYLMRDGQLRPISRDHSLVQGMVDRCEIAAEAAEGHPLASVVTRAVGAAPSLDLEVCHGPLAAGDLLLLCSDGLSKMVPDRLIEALLRRHGDAAGQPLLDEALAAGGRDNISVVVIAATEADPARCDPDASA